MKIRFYILNLFLFTLLLSFFGLVSVKSAFADTVTLQGTVKTSIGGNVSGATVDIDNVGTTTIVESGITDGSGDYSISVPSGTYDIYVIPPSGSSYSTIVADSYSISSNTIINFVFAPVGSVSLSGYVYDQSGNGLADQDIFIYDPSSNSYVGTTTTDSTGFYSVQVTAGTYRLIIRGEDNSSSLNAPNQYSISEDNYSLSESKYLNITLPEYKVSVHIQDSSSNPISEVALATSSTLVQVSNLSIGGGITDAYGYSNYNQGDSINPVTDSSGNTAVWLFPNPSTSQKYALIATPPSGSSYGQNSLSNLVITSNTSETITLPPVYALSGHVIDPLGNSLLSQDVFLFDPSTNSYVDSTTTDSSGNYTMHATAGTYRFIIRGEGNDVSLNAPQQYSLSEDNYSFTGNQTLNVTTPAKKITVHVQDSSGNPISGVTLYNSSSLVQISNLAMNSSITDAYGYSNYNQQDGDPVTNSSGNATLWLFPNGSTSQKYSIIATPPSGSSYNSNTLSNQTFTADTNVTMTLTQPVTLQGYIYDPSGTTGLDGQLIYLYDPSTNSYAASTTTDSSGYYSMTANTGSYTFIVRGENNDVSIDAPQQYSLSENSYNLSGNTILNIIIPAKKVTVHVQDNFNNPVENISLATQNNNIQENNLTISSGITDAYGYSTYNQGESNEPVTNSSGDTTMWLFPNGSSTDYSLIATPPSGSIYSTFTLNNVAVTSDQTEVISLQYNHATPVTTATLSPTPFTDGTYADPTTVTLSATAASGFTIANTFYKIDGGSQQTYTAPFTVTGSGSHTITYWSVDNSGVTEATNTKTFIITESYSLTGTVYNDANQNGSQGTGENGYAGATVTLNTGQSITTDSNGNYTFANLEAGTYIDTLTVPSGYIATTTNPADVALSANTTQNFGIAQASSLVTAINAGGDTEGSFASDEDFSGGTTYSSSTSVDTSGVTNPAPLAVYQSVRFGNFTYTAPNLTPNTNYTLRLHFNEVYFGANGNSGGVGSRVFNVSVNGTNALSNFDIYQAAGGANKAVVEEVPATSDSSGNITVQFSSVVDNAMVNGIEVDSGSPATTPTPTPTPITSEAINAGGDTEGSFVSDIDSTGGSAFSTTADVDTTGVTNSAPESVYQSVRYGNFTYDLTNFAPNSSHTVRLHFSEPYWGTALSSNQGGDGSRVFNVSINGTQVLTNFDVYQTAGGADKAVIEEFPVSADSNGKISIQFTTVTDNAMVSGIEVN